MSKDDKNSAQNYLNLSIRLATESDATALAELRFDFRQRIAESNGKNCEDKTKFVRRCAEWMQKRLGEESSRWSCLIAEMNDETVGHLWLEIFEKIPNPISELEKHAYLTNFYVVENRRGQGIGAKLLTFALEHCRQEKADSVILWATPDSRSLYLRSGFAVSQTLLECKLE